MPSLRKVAILAPVIRDAAAVLPQTPLPVGIPYDALLAFIADVVASCAPGSAIKQSLPSDLFMAAVALHDLMAFDHTPAAIVMVDRLAMALEHAIAQDINDHAIDRFQLWTSEHGGSRMITGVPDKLVAFRVPGEDDERAAPVSGFYEWIGVFNATCDVSLGPVRDAIAAMVLIQKT